MARRLLIVSGCMLLLAGCGSKKKAQEPPGGLYRRGPVISCLRAHDFTVSTSLKDVNFVAYSATGGGLRAWENGTHKQVDLIAAFGQSNDDARQTLRALERFARRPPIFRWRERRANAVVLFAYRPSSRTLRLVRSCLDASVRRPPRG
jgi:hypothetical protein